ncbi:MAG: hypothetical protein H7138_12705, partial [Myxococcales bacterium]|nr:hypothetical protein [Myxococcales bacterium]
PPLTSPVAVVASTLTATAECGVATPPAVDLMISNSGTADLVIRSAMVEGGFTVATALPVTVAPGAQRALSIVPPAAVIGTDRGGGTKTGTLTLVTNEIAMGERTVELTANVLGANLAFTDEAGAAIVLAFAGTSGACPVSKTVFVRNTGTSTLTLGAASASAFAFSAYSGAFGGFSGGTLAPGAFVTQEIRPVTDVACTGSGPVTYAVSGTVCSAPNAAVVGAFNITGASSCFCS